MFYTALFRLGAREDTDCGPLIDAAAVNKVAQLVDDAVSRGAKVLCGGKTLDQDGCFYLPTVLTDVAAGSAMEREEIFGPVAPIYVFDTEDEVIARANDTEIGRAHVCSTRRCSDWGGEKKPMAGR